jgi:hypothetical protein
MNLFNNQQGRDLEIKRLKVRVSTQDAKLQSEEEEGTEDDLRFGRRDSGSANNTTAEAEELRVLNEKLTKQLGLSFIFRVSKFDHL